MGKFKELWYEIRQKNPRDEPDEVEFLTKKQYNQMIKEEAWNGKKSKKNLDNQHQKIK